MLQYVVGDGKSAPNPLFRVKVILEGDKVEFSPTLKQLAQDVGSIGTHLTESIAGISRLPDILTRKRSNKEVGAAHGQCAVLLCNCSNCSGYCVI